MTYLRRPEWALKEKDATPEHVFRNRRRFMAGGFALAGAGVIAGGAMAQSGGGLFGWLLDPDRAAADTIDLTGTPFTPAPARNPDYAAAGRPITDEGINSTYNNFYEFASHKRIYDAAQALPTEDWTVTIDGMVETPMTLSMDDLLKKVAVEERVVRHRCVEAWSMVVPWIGFKLSDLLSAAAPLSSAKYVRFESFKNPSVAPGQRAGYYPWPYIEGLTIDEAAHELSFMVVGAYGKVLPKQFGAPIRLHTPWKYGFKSNKSITRITLTDQRPISFWEQVLGEEYGFWANVNPAVPHRRWSQATERVLGTDDRIPTELYNGYGAQVAGLYADKQDLGDRLYR